MMGVGVSEELLAFGEDDPRVGRQHAGDAGGHLVGSRGFQLEGDVGRRHHRAVDGLDGGGVGDGGEPDLHLSVPRC